MKAYANSLIALALLSFAPLSANDDFFSDDDESYYDSDAQPCQKAFRPALDEPFWMVQTDFLYWRTLLSNVDFAIKGQPLPPVDTETGPIGDYKSARFSWDPGVRVSLQKAFCSTFWNLGLTYTYFHNSGAQKVTAPPLATSQLIVSTFNETSRLDHVKSHIELSLNSGDLSLSKRFAIQDKILMKPSAGVAACWLDLDWSLFYAPIADSDPSEKLDHSNRFSGAGPIFAIETEWLLGAGLSFLSKFSTAAYVGSFHEKNFAMEITDESDVTLNAAYLKESRFVPSVQIALGPCWGEMFSWGGFSLFAGYEMLSFFNFQEINRSGVSVSESESRPSHLSQGTLTTQGLTLQMTLIF